MGRWAGSLGFWLPYCDAFERERYHERPRRSWLTLRHRKTLICLDEFCRVTDGDYGDSLQPTIYLRHAAAYLRHAAAYLRHAAAAAIPSELCETVLITH